MDKTVLDSRIKVEVVYRLTERGINSIINENFPTSNFEIAADQEAGNDSSLTFNVTPEDATASDLEWDQDEWQKFLSGRGQWHTQTVLDHLAFLGKIPAGEYVIDVSW